MTIEVARETGRQCEYMSYMEAIEADRKRIPTHVHRMSDGRFIERAWGPQERCTWQPEEVAQ